MISAYSRSPEGAVVTHSEGAGFDGNIFLVSIGDAASDAARCLVLVNAERAKVGLTPLAFDSRLNKCSADYAAVLATPGVPFSHTGPDGSSPFDRIKRVGFPLDGWSAENIAGGFATADAVMVAWMNSPGHKANILGPHFTVVGIGVAGGYWVQDFGQLSTPPPVAVTLAGISLTPQQVTGGSPITGTVTLTGPAPSPVTVTLACSCSPSYASIPSSAIVPAGANGATFTIVTFPVPEAGVFTATVTAALGAVSKQATFTASNVTPPPPGGRVGFFEVAYQRYGGAAVPGWPSKIIGHGFGTVPGSVSIAGIPIPANLVFLWHDTWLIVVPPSNLKDQIGPIVVTPAGGTPITSSETYLYSANGIGDGVDPGPPDGGPPPPPASVPVISAITPMVAAVGDIVAITGQHFGAQPGTVALGGLLVTPPLSRDWTDTEIRFLVPALAVTGPVVVHNAAGVSNAMTLTIQGTPPSGGPKLSAIAPDHGLIGSTVTVTGSGFDNTCYLIFSSADGQGRRGGRFSVNSSALASQVPAGAVSGPVHISRHSDNTVSNSLPFTVSPAAPGEGSQGDGA